LQIELLSIMAAPMSYDLSLLLDINLQIACPGEIDCGTG
jgi:hypothetical protein